MDRQQHTSDVDISLLPVDWYWYQKEYTPP